MNRDELFFERPPALQATAPPEARGLQRDEVRLLVSEQRRAEIVHTHSNFRELANFFRAGDLLVVNDSQTLPASLPATSAVGPHLINLSTNYGDGLWLAEPRWGTGQPGPLPLEPSEQLLIANVPARLVAPYPGLPRLWFVQADGDLTAAMQQRGQPIRYGYVEQPYPLAAYQTMFACTPGSAEMPSAARPFTPRVLETLQARGIELASITLHTGVSSLEVESERVEDHPLYAEPFHVPVTTARLVNATRQAGGRVIAVGTTVVRALESAWNGHKVEPARGFTRRYVHPAHGVHTVDGLISGFHDPLASHLAMLYAIAGKTLILSGYAEAVAQGYLWHEFGDSHLVLTR